MFNTQLKNRMHVLRTICLPTYYYYYFLRYNKQKI
jgi:hypothetical protein